MVEQEGQLSDERSTQSEQAENSMQALLDNQDFAFKEPKRGETVSGTVVRIEPHEILVDIGSKFEGVINGRELEGIPREFLAELKVGDTVQTVVISTEDRNGHIVLALSRSHTDHDWDDAESLFQSQDVFEGIVAGHNKGGLIVKVGKVRGFVPASQLVSGRGKAESGEQQDAPAERWASLTGQKLQLKVIELDRQRNRLILSERAAMRDWRKIQKEKLLSELKEGDVREGKVISLADFGAFIDLGGADGLVHLSEISWKRVNHPREILKVGQKARVQVINVDPDRKRIGLSLKRLEADPWTTIESRYKTGQLVEGTITKLAKFGAFARVKGDEEVEGLIHISELSEGHVNHPKEVVHEGQLVTLRIIRIDSQERRLGLSLKRVAKGEYADADWQQGMVGATKDEDVSSEPAPPEEPQAPSEEPQAVSEELQAPSEEPQVPFEEPQAPPDEPQAPPDEPGES